MKLLNRYLFPKLLLCYLSIAIPSQGFQLHQSLNKELPIQEIPMELNKTLMEVWCNGVNYTALCVGWPGWPDPRRCFGEVMQGEVATIKKITDLYNYPDVLLGDMLMNVECKQRENMDIPLEDEAMNEEVTFWIIVLVAIVTLGILATIGVISAHLYNKRGTLETESNSASSNVQESTATVKQVRFIQEV